MKKIFANMYGDARHLNDDLILKTLHDLGPFDSLLDVGCWNGELTEKYAKAANAKRVLGIEVVDKKAGEARKKGVICHSCQADRDVWPYENESIDCVVSNQVIEHLSDVDHFFKEASRVLRKNGVLITSTNNLASWHNIGALFFGWAPFDLTNSTKISAGIGNPLSVHRGENIEHASWTHKCIYTPRWLFEWQNLYGLKKVSHHGAGFYPLPARIGNIFKNHAAFMVIATRKK